MRTRKKTIYCKVPFFLFCLFFIVGCSMEDEPVMEVKSPDGAADQIAHLKQVTKDGPVYLSGIQNYYTYAPKNNELLQDADIPCDVILEFLQGHNFNLTITEYTTPPRGGVLFGTMTPSGEISVSFPVPYMVLPDGSSLNITDIIEMHGGCELMGPGINKGTLIYQGFFDGERLLISAPFHSKCEVEWPANDVFPTPVDGPIHWSWTIDVTVD